MPTLDAATIIAPALNDEATHTLTATANMLASAYENFAVTTADEYSFAGHHLKEIKTKRDEIEQRRLTMTRPLDAAKKAVMDFFRPFTERLDHAEDQVKAAMVTYSTEQQRIADAAARKAREAADKEAARLRELASKADEAAAENERRRLAEQQRLAAKRAANEAERIAAERAAAKTKADKQRAEEQAAAEARRQEAELARLHNERLAAEAAQRERTAKAENLEARALATTTAPVAPATPKIAGISQRETWKYEITNRQLIPDEYWIVDERAIGAVVKALKGQTNIAGVRVYAETAIAAGKS